MELHALPLVVTCSYALLPHTKDMQPWDEAEVVCNYPQTQAVSSGFGPTALENPNCEIKLGTESRS